MPKLRMVPIRFKIMIGLLFLVTAVVSIITFTMAYLFHSDKKSYISDVSALVASHAVEEANVILEGYQNRLQVYGRILANSALDGAARERQIRALLQDFPGLLALTVYRDGREVARLSDAAAFAAAGLTAEQLTAYRSEHPLPQEAILGGLTFVENSSISPALPSLTMAVATRGEEAEKPLVLEAVVRLDDLERVVCRSTVFDVFIVTRGGDLLAHRDVARVVARDRVTELPELNERVLAVAREFKAGGQDMIGGFAAGEMADVVAGAMVPAATANFASHDLLNKLLSVALALLLVTALSGLIWSTTLTGPMSHLVAATRVIAQGRFDVRVDVRARDEIGTLADSFNTMAMELLQREAALKTAQAQLVQSEKMAAFGQLGAGIAHEVKNPLAGILGMAQIYGRQAEAGGPIQQAMATIEKETKRCKTIIDNLLKFARQEKVHLEPTDVGLVIQDAASIMRHQLELKGVKLETEVDEGLPQIDASANQLQQIFMNLMLNAQQAMEGRPGHVLVTARREQPGTVVLRVKDDGPGIPKHIQQRIFEPFFTTKPAGQGTGLGLSVTFGIVRDHGGAITVESEPGQGTTFVITLPESAASAANPPAAGPAPEARAA